MSIENSTTEELNEPQKFITNKGNWTGAPPHKRKNPARYLENCKYDSRPLDPNYFKNYMNTKITCPNCNRIVSRGNMTKHKQSKICLKNKIENS